MSLCCRNEERRDAVRDMDGWNGFDYLEVSDDQRRLQVFFLGKMPPEFVPDRPGLENYLRLEGGSRVTDIHITDVDPKVDPDPEKDDYLVVRLDKYGDFSTYTLRLVGVENIDPRYDHVDFTFKVDCPQDLDCATECECEPEPLPEPPINYLAKDYASFRQLILDRLALLVPDWTERHVPDVGIALVELLAYTADYLSYHQDAVATEAYLDKARQRISVRRHARLVDYRLHEGCNARAWVSLAVSADLVLDPADAYFITGLNDALLPRQTVLSIDDVAEIPSQDYEVFEPLTTDSSRLIELHQAHNELHFYTWGDTECCLERGSISATLVDTWVAGDPAETAGDSAGIAGDPARTLAGLIPGVVLVFEEVLGPVTGLAADADPNRRHAVRLTRVTPRKDPVGGDDGAPSVPVVEIEWSVEDALPFPFCLSTVSAAPECTYLERISVARGNVILVDHGARQRPENLGEVPVAAREAICECAGEPGDVRLVPGRIGPSLGKGPLTFAVPLPVNQPDAVAPAGVLLNQDVRAAVPQIWLASAPEAAWEPRQDLVDSGPNDKHFVVEIDDHGTAILRFGDGELACLPPAGMQFAGTYRIGNGTAGNVGAESISRLVLRNTQLSGVTLTVRNPLPALGGTDPEPSADAKLMAPHAFRQQLERAVIADDYAEIAQRNPAVQRAAGALAWSGSWYEAEVAIDPVGLEHAPDPLLAQIHTFLERYRRMGHDLHVRQAQYVPIDLKLEVCAAADYQRAHIKAALLERFSNRRRAGGGQGFFHVDQLTFGEGVLLSRIVAAAHAVTGVTAVRVIRLQRLFEAPNREIDNGILPLAANEVARLDNDPNYPEHGKLEIDVRGGR